MNVLCLGRRSSGRRSRASSSTHSCGATFDGGERYVARLAQGRRDGKGDEAWQGEVDDSMSSPRAGSRSGSTRSRASSSDTGELKRMMKDDAVTGVTSNPTIFQKALSEGDAYDERAEGAARARPTTRPRSSSRSRSQDIRDACDVLKPAYDASDGVDGYVSMEVEPGIAYDTERTFEQARWIAKEVDRPNLMVKIPATMPGLPAIEDSIAHGTSINITLIFSLERYKAVVEAYLRGLERLDRGRRRPVEGRVRRVVLRLARRHRGRQAPRGASGNTELQGKLAIANAKLAYAALPARRSRARAGSTSRARARRSSAACGRRPRRRTPPTAT